MIAAGFLFLGSLLFLMGAPSIYVGAAFSIGTGITFFWLVFIALCNAGALCGVATLQAKGDHERNGS